MRVLFIFLLILLNISLLKSQNFNANFIGGIDFTQVGGDNLSGFNEFGFIAGIGVSRKIQKKNKRKICPDLYEFQLLYVDKGSRDTISDPFADGYKYQIKLRYIEVPLMCMWKIVGKENKNLSVGVGGSVSFLIKGSETDEHGNIPGTRPFNEFDISSLFEIGYLHSRRLYFFSRFENSLIPMRSIATSQKITLREKYRTGQFNTVLMFGCKYMLGSDKKGFN